MKTHELLELAALDAMGLLDTDERETFEAAFRAASPALQAQIRREQLRLSRMDDTLPEVEPPIGMRARVLAAIREAITTIAPKPVTQAPVVHAAAPRLRPVHGVHRIWRVAAVGATAAAFVLGFATLRFRNDYQVVSDTINANGVSDKFLNDFGSKFDQAFFDPSVRLVAFASSSPTAPRSGKAALLLDPANGRGQLFLKDLPLGDNFYEVVVVSSDGRESKSLKTFQAPAAGINIHAIDGISLENASMIVIRKIGDAEPLLVAKIA